jgi:hypothetical protein
MQLLGACPAARDALHPPEPHDEDGGGGGGGVHGGSGNTVAVAAAAAAPPVGGANAPGLLLRAARIIEARAASHFLR